ncbi:unnamed protein product [Onchocerca flexuosa]|uniref:LysM domain-containing protein n=1 Tax=Onchocerca flexuosa TaxID=387005 RepID=A0A183I686_9BILA|nr:unnamed protein product [Onchocerca flexuosa]
MDDQDERTFLCSYQRTRGYGSLSNPHVPTKAYRTIIQHQIGPNDTLQGLVLKYNTSIPIYDEIIEEDCISDRSINVKDNRGESIKSQDIDGESLQDIFKRIDMNIRKTTNSVHKLTENSTAGLLTEGFQMEFMQSKPEGKINNRCSLSRHSSGYQNEAYQN